MPTRDRLKNALLQSLADSDASTFVQEHIFDRVPYAFEGDRGEYLNWKSMLADGLGVDPSDITVVGSAAAGISLNPHKSFKNFGPDSDIDVAVISNYHFMSAWRFLRQNKNMRFRLQARQRDAWDEHRTNLLFFGTIATDRLLPLFPFGAEWLAAMTRVAAASKVNNEIKVRVYNDYDSLRSYTTNSVKSAQTKYLG